MHSFIFSYMFINASGRQILTIWVGERSHAQTKEKEKNMEIQAEGRISEDTDTTMHF